MYIHTSYGTVRFRTVSNCEPYDNINECSMFFLVVRSEGAIIFFLDHHVVSNELMIRSNRMILDLNFVAYFSDCRKHIIIFNFTLNFTIIFAIIGLEICLVFLLTILHLYIEELTRKTENEKQFHKLLWQNPICQVGVIMAESNLRALIISSIGRIQFVIQGFISFVLYLLHLFL